MFISVNLATIMINFIVIVDVILYLYYFIDIMLS